MKTIRLVCWGIIGILSALGTFSLLANWSWWGKDAQNYSLFCPQFLVAVVVEIVALKLYKP